ncbi:MAG TPA: cytochrome c-type biogenesis protein [Alphaproteobacteria bacterium]|nr:cytochrome c-type biogenesis protein [Alphaproteobacteria bacterium]
MTALLRSLALALALLLPLAAGAVEPGEKLADPALEARARGISQHLRCLVCQNQSIDDSNAGLAKDLRVLVRERLTAGDTDEQVMDFVVQRYGSFVLLKPPFKPETYALWLGPAAILLVAGFGVAVFLRRRRTEAVVESAPLTEAEKRRLAALTDGSTP